MTPPTIKPCATCLQFKDFETSKSSGKIYYSAAQVVTATCPDGTVSRTPLDAGILSYALNFELGNPPYPNLILNCSGGQISIPVPDKATQADLDALINGMLNQCLSRIAISISCLSGTFYNTVQYMSCDVSGFYATIGGAVPAGVDVESGGLQRAYIESGVIQSIVSVEDANAKALQVLQSLFNSGNLYCNPGSS